MKNFRKYFLRGSLSHLLPLGAGFIMASSKSLEAALGMSVAVIVITVLSAIVVSAIRKVTPEKAHLPIYVLIVTGFTTLVCMLFEAYWYNAFDALGVHLAALAVSAVPYRDAEELASENGERKTIICSLVTGLIFAFVMVLCALLTILLVPTVFEAKITKFICYVFLAIVIAAMRKVGHKICNDLEGEESCH